MLYIVHRTIKIIYCYTVYVRGEFYSLLTESELAEVMTALDDILVDPHTLVARVL